MLFFLKGGFWQSWFLLEVCSCTSFCTNNQFLIAHHDTSCYWMTLITDLLQKSSWEMTYVVVFWFVYLLLLLVFRRNQLFITFALFKTLNEIITLFTLPAALTANSSRVHIGVIKVSVIKTGSTSFCLHIEDVNGSKFQLQTRSSALFWNDSASLSWKSFIGRGPFSNRHSCVCWAYASYRVL